jgi:hypothetical protein
MGAILNPVAALISDIFGGSNAAPAPKPAPKPAAEPAAESEPSRAAAVSPNVTSAPSRAAVGANADGTSRDIGNIGASGATMLTGPVGVDEKDMSLGKKTLLGA